jgi:hypothetical protein
MPKQFATIPADLKWEDVRMISMQERTILLIMGRHGQKLEIEFETKEQVAKALAAAGQSGKFQPVS